MRISGVSARYLPSSLAIGGVAIILLLLTACGGGSSGHEVEGAPDGDSFYRDALYLGCESEEARELDDGSHITPEQCRCVMDLAADDTGSYKTFMEQANEGSIDSSTFALANFGGVMACINQ